MGIRYHVDSCLVCHCTSSSHTDRQICDACTAKGYVQYDPTQGKKLGFWKAIWLIMTPRPYRQVVKPPASPVPKQGALRDYLLHDVNELRLETNDFTDAGWRACVYSFTGDTSCHVRDIDYEHLTDIDLFRVYRHLLYNRFSPVGGPED